MEEGNFAFIWDSLAIEYWTQRKPCNLRAVGNLFDKSGYGIGLQKNSPYTDAFSQIILQLRQQGFMDDLYNKW